MTRTEDIKLTAMYERLSRDDEQEWEETQMAERKDEHDAIVERAKTDPEAAQQTVRSPSS